MLKSASNYYPFSLPFLYTFTGEMTATEGDYFITFTCTNWILYGVGGDQLDQDL
jgi:hypothetical protein